MTIFMLSKAFLHLSKAFAPFLPLIINEYFTGIKILEKTYEKVLGISRALLYERKSGLL